MKIAIFLLVTCDHLMSLLMHLFKTVHDLQAVEVRHHEVGEADEPAIYRIKDELVIFLSCFFSLFVRTGEINCG